MKIDSNDLFMPATAEASVTISLDMFHELQIAALASTQVEDLTKKLQKTQTKVQELETILTDITSGIQIVPQTWDNEDNYYMELNAAAVRQLINRCGEIPREIAPEEVRGYQSVFNLLSDVGRENEQKYKNQEKKEEK